MSDSQKRLASTCRRVGDVAKNILDWVGESGEIVPAERVALLHEVYRAETSASLLARALDEGPAVAIAGLSRSGKTQLLASLAERDGGTVSIRFEGIREQVGLIKYLCPEGTRTGRTAVLRLTARPRPASQNFPVVVRLLSMSDLVKILGAMFLAGAEPRALEPSTIRIDQAIAEARARIAAEPVAGLGEEEIWDIRHYFTTRFGDQPLVRALLTSGYWESLTEIAGRLPNAARARALAVLWGGDDRITDLFEELAGAVAGLGCGREARCALDAVLGLDSRTGRFQRRADSIISAATLNGLGQPDAATLVVSNEHGQWVSLPRPVLAAIVAEVRLPVPDSSSELLARADLLSFPAVDGLNAGGHSMREIERDPAQLGPVFMRAKSSFLLERYTDEQSITALAVCVDPASPRLTELGSLVSAWIEKSHGADPAARESQANGLFVCLTKLDKEFQEPARRGKERRIDWARHITTALIDGIARNQSWASEWTPGRAFDNLHLLRLPGAKAKHLLAYASDGREIGYKPEQAGRIERAGRDFLATPLVQRHVADPASVWNEAMELNDGGATYLAQSLASVCDDHAKRRHVSAGLCELGLTLKDRLQRYHVSDDIALQQDRRRISALIATRWLKRCAEENRLGYLIGGLQLADDEFHDILARFEGQVAIPTRLEGQDETRHSQTNGHALAGVSSSEPRQIKTAAKGNGQLPNAAQTARTFAALAMTHWVASVRLFAQADRIAQTLQIPRKGLLLIVDELIAGTHRLDLEARIAAEIEALIIDDPEGEHMPSRAALVAANLIGDYVMWLGFDDVRSNAHPRRKGRAGSPIFPPRSATDAFADAGGGSNAGRAFLTDWSQAFLALVSANAEELGQGPRDAERNRRLGEFLADLTVTL